MLFVLFDEDFKLPKVWTTTVCECCAWVAIVFALVSKKVQTNTLAKGTKTNTLVRERRVSRIIGKLSLASISTSQLTFYFYAVRPRSLVFTRLLVCLSDLVKSNRLLIENIWTHIIGVYLVRLANLWPFSTPSSACRYFVGLAFILVISSFWSFCYLTRLTLLQFP